MSGSNGKHLVYCGENRGEVGEVSEELQRERIRHRVKTSASTEEPRQDEEQDGDTSAPVRDGLLCREDGGLRGAYRGRGASFRVSLFQGKTCKEGPLSARRAFGGENVRKAHNLEVEAGIDGKGTEEGRNEKASAILRIKAG